MHHTFGLLQLASCLLSIEERRSLRLLAHKAGSTLGNVSIDDLSVLYSMLTYLDSISVDHG